MWRNFCQLPKMAKSDSAHPYWSIIPSLVEIGALLEFGQCGKTFASCPKWQNRTQHILLVHYTKFGWNRSTFRIWAMWQNFCQLPKMAIIGLGTSYWSIIPSLVEIGALLEFGQTFASCPKWQNRTRYILLVHYTKFGWNRSIFRIWANICQLPKMAKSESAHPTGPLYQVWLKSEHFLEFGQTFCQLPKMAKSDSAHPTGPLYQVWLKSEHF